MVGRPPRQRLRSSLLAFLDDLKRHVRRQKAILVWGPQPAHKSRAMQEYLLRQRGWLTVERLPGYAPDLNPIETRGGTSNSSSTP